MNPNQALWEPADFTRIAASMRASGEALVDGLCITPGLKVLDLGCADGTTALPAAHRGADVLGVDVASNLVAAGTRRAAQAGLSNCRFIEGDASDLGGLENRSFDRVISIFGAMFAPSPMKVAAEMVRVTRAGGVVVMGNWIPNDPTLVAQVLRISSSYAAPPPEGFVNPMTWGMESHVIERFGAAGIARGDIAFARDTYTFRHAGSPASFVDLFCRYYGPTMNAFAAAHASGRGDELHIELDKLFDSQNCSTDALSSSFAASFLRVTVLVH